MLTKRREMTTDILNENHLPHSASDMVSSSPRTLFIWKLYLVIVNCNQRIDSLRVNRYGIWIVCDSDPVSSCETFSFQPLPFTPLVITATLNTFHWTRFFFVLDNIFSVCCCVDKILFDGHLTLSRSCRLKGEKWIRNSVNGDNTKLPYWRLL